MQSVTAQRTTWVVSVVLAFALVSILVYRGSYAALSATTTNPGNTWSAFGITLTDNRNGTALFTSSDMLPGDSESKCILVTYEGSTPPDAVRLYVTDVTGTDSVSGTGELTDELDVSIHSDADSDGATDCSTFDSTDEVQAATALSTMPTGYAGGVELDPAASTDWTPDDGESRAFKVTVSLPIDAALDVQGDSASATFTWEAQKS